MSEMIERLKNILDSMSQEEFEESWNELYANDEYTEEEVDQCKSLFEMWDNQAKIDEIRKLEFNWDDNKAQPIDEKICDFTHKFLPYILQNPRVYPEPNKKYSSGIRLDFEHKNLKLEIVIFENFANILFVESGKEYEIIWKDDQYFYSSLTMVIAQFYNNK